MLINHNDFCQLQPDGSIECGDCVNWYGHWLYLEGRSYTIRFTSIFEVQPGAYVRHPDPELTNYGFGAEYHGPYDGCITRDQKTGILAALIATKNKNAVKRLIKHHAYTGFLFSYSQIKRGEDIRDGVRRFPDITGPEIWQMEVRGAGYNAWPFFFLCDIWLCLMTIYDRFSSDEDNISFLMQIFVALDVRPTILSGLLIKLLDLEQQKNKLKKYWGGWRQKSWMIELYVNKLKELGVE